LLAFTLDIDSAMMTLSFSETINGATFDPSQITMQSKSNGGAAGAAVYNLTGGANFTRTRQTNISFVLLKEDLDAIKDINGFATVEADTFVSLSGAMVKDTALRPNEIKAIPIGAGLQASSVTKDSTSPAVLSFTFDLDAGIFNVSVTEPVSSDINVTAFSIFSANGACGHRLSNASTVSFADGHRRIIISLSADDLDAIKARSALGTDAASTVLVISSEFAMDKAGNKIVPVSRTDAKSASAVEADLTRPTLVSFQLDLRTNQLKMIFSEAVNLTSFKPTGVTLLGSKGATAPALTYTLTGGTIANITSPADSSCSP
jgi:hypothetical protein